MEEALLVPLGMRWSLSTIDDSGERRLALDFPCEDGKRVRVSLSDYSARVLVEALAEALKESDS